MTSVKENFSLEKLNTFRIDVKARYFARPTSIDELIELLDSKRSLFPFLIIGGGSNILFTRDFNGLVIQPFIKGIKIIEDNLEFCLVEVAAGENWDTFVEWAVTNKLGGIENLSLIPGSTGSSPIQNIGAYGAEVKDVIEKVNYLDLENLQVIAVKNSDCQFDYRSSIFKTLLRNRIIITSVLFRLRRRPDFNTTYGNLNEEVIRLGEVNLKTIREAVINIRRSKLPDPEIIGNAGSFFKNPVIDSGTALQLKDIYDNMPLYPVSDKWTKIPAGWLIEKCGWKGKKTGNAGVHDKQALVLINCGNAKGTEIYDLSVSITDSVFSKFGIKLETEVNII